MGRKSLHRSTLNAVALTAISVSTDRCLATITYDLRAVAATGSTQVVDAKTVRLGAVGDVVNLELWAIMQGQNANPDDEGLTGFIGSFVSSNVIGNGTARGTIATAFDEDFARPAPSSLGTSQDLDGDGDLDVGSNDPSRAIHHFAGWYTHWPDPVTSFGSVQRIALASFTITQLLEAPGSTVVDHRIRNSNTSSHWFEDGDLLTAGPTSGLVFNEPGVALIVPEPAMTAAWCAGFAFIGLSRRGQGRRNRLNRVIMHASCHEVAKPDRRATT